MNNTNLFIKQLTTIDSSYLCSWRGLVGETWLMDIALYGELNEQGMLFDFGDIKSTIKSTVDQLLDHKLLVPEAPWVDLKQHNGRSDITAKIIDEKRTYMVQYRAPEQAIEQISTEAITAQTLQAYLSEKIAAVLPDNVHKLDILLYQEIIEGPFYHYSHGLKKHQGNCQRLIHGHRSAFSIFIDGKHAEEEEMLWATQWQDITLVTEEDIQHRYLLNNIEYLCVGYHAPQGYFEMALPADRAHLVNTDTTVELIAHYLAHKVSEKYDNATVKVTAYEGYNKGATTVISS